MFNRKDNNPQYYHNSFHIDNIGEHMEKMFTLVHNDIDTDDKGKANDKEQAGQYDFFYDEFIFR